LKTVILAVVLSLAIGRLVSSSQPESQNRSINLTISAAISLTEPLQAIRTLYRRQSPNVSLTFNLGASGILEQQIEEGAPVDIFISASPEEMNALASQGLLLNQTRRNLLKNTLVLICPSSSKVSGFMDLTRPDVKRVAMANPESVPAGAYARQTLENFKIYQRIYPKILFAQDVRQALAYVETDNADAGLVYATEAKLSHKVRVAAVAPENSHAPIVYPIAVIKRCRHAEAAERFVQYLSGPEAQRIFEREGFVPVEK
jgi:molybdate transport system substrate-binding protein